MIHNARKITLIIIIIILKHLYSVVASEVLAEQASCSS